MDEGNDQIQVKPTTKLLTALMFVAGGLGLFIMFWNWSYSEGWLIGKPIWINPEWNRVHSGIDPIGFRFLMLLAVFGFMDLCRTGFTAMNRPTKVLILKNTLDTLLPWLTIVATMMFRPINIH